MDEEVERVAILLHATADRLHLIHGLSAWDRRERMEGGWRIVVPGLTEDLKDRWREMARMVLGMVDS